VPGLVAVERQRAVGPQARGQPIVRFGQLGMVATVDRPVGRLGVAV
jgi:hypothetical protein